MDPEGRLHRAKVLSTSALRGSVRESVAADALRIEEDWGAADGLVRGFAFALLGGGVTARVAEYDAASRILRLDRPHGGAPPGAPFELRSPEPAPVLAARLLTGTPAGDALPPLDLRLATTRGTNALLERQGEPVALFVTRGHGDLLRIGDQRRPELFALRIEKPAPLFTASVEVAERLAADGSVLEPLDIADSAMTERIGRLADEGVRTAAVALLHSYRNPGHEEQLRDLLLRSGFTHVSLSSELAPLIGILPRAETAVVNAYVAAPVGEYIEAVRDAVPDGTLHVMTSAGGLTAAPHFRPKDGLLSGPAAGVVGAAFAGRRSGFERVLTFDMGGTSTDVARASGEHDYLSEHQVVDARIVAPALAIETVAAGGGSICGYGVSGLYVGPLSAGASPGPACYGAGGPLTLTDVNLLLGRLSPERFGIPVNAEPARDALYTISSALREARGDDAEPEALLAGFLEIADERMADAIRAVSLRRGYDPAEHALVAFGGAGPQHACGVAGRLGVDTIVVPADAGLLSADGIGAARVERFAQRQVLEPLGEMGDRLATTFASLDADATDAVVAEGIARQEVAIRRRIANLRLLGQESTLAIDWQPEMALADAFDDRYEAVYAHRPEGKPLEVESLRVVASTPADGCHAAATPTRHEAEPTGSARAWFDGWREVPSCDRDRLAPGARLEGPALVWEQHSATVVADGWSAEVDGAGALVLRRSPDTAEASTGRTGDAVAAVVEELFTHRFEALVGEMGEQLRRTALSTNVKERLDFSCALLDADGELVANAPHIPVHLGALGLCVRRVREALPLGPRDTAVTNHPAFGGSHLPDVTTITPVFSSDRLVGYVANRAHHAEIGGAAPGSMPPGARSLAEEGVVVPPLYLVRGGEARWERLRALLDAGPYPSRATDDNLADLRAQLAANRRGERLLAALADEHGVDTVARYMAALTARSDRGARRALTELGDGVRAASERLDDGSVLAVEIRVAGGQATFDFAGTSGVHPSNLNATPAIVRSAVLYVLRLLLEEPLPLNEGLLRPVTLRIPEGLLNPDFPDDPALAPAVVGGNTEVSQRLVDTLLKALGVAACSQGTMNNTLFGDGTFGFYETVCGGSGAGPGWHGASAVHTHMTNTRITDPEILEHRYPVRVERCAIRRGSGGAGEWSGGDGVVRELCFLAPLRLSLLTQHRRELPYGCAGGAAGTPGRQRVVRASGEEAELASTDGCGVEPGDRLVLETPGGGGWGDASAT